MSMSALVSALRSAGRQRLSAGSLVTTPVTGSYLFRIEQYTRLQKMVASGTMVESGTFGVGGHDWRIQCYPNGDRGSEGYISLYLAHASHAKTGDATADARMSILDHAGEPSHTDGESETQGDAKRFSGHGSLEWGWRNFVKIEDLDEEKDLKDDCLTVLCDVTVLDMRTTGDRAGSVVPPSDLDVTVPDMSTTGDPAGSVVPPSDMDVTVLDMSTTGDPAASVDVTRRTTGHRAGTVVPPSDLHRQLTQVLWESKEGVDLEIEVGGETFPAHRWLLAARSPVFKAELLLSSAALSSRIRVDKMDAGVFKALLHFIYTDALPKEMVEKPEALVTMAEPLLLAADRYKLERLKLICEEALCEYIDAESLWQLTRGEAKYSLLAILHSCSHAI
ncbi:unnamed protein product [Alopecurus aequalis]